MIRNFRDQKVLRVFRIWSWFPKFSFGLFTKIYVRKFSSKIYVSAKVCVHKLQKFVIFQIRKTSWSLTFLILKIRLRLSSILKASKNKSRYVKVGIFWKFFQYTIHWHKTQMLTKSSTGQKKNVAKNALFFLSWASTHQFCFNSWFSYELKHKFRFSNSVCRIFHFRFRFVLLKFIFLFKKTFKTS